MTTRERTVYDTTLDPYVFTVATSGTGERSLRSLFLRLCGRLTSMLFHPFYKTPASFSSLRQTPSVPF